MLAITESIMVNIEALNFESLAKWYYFANTPSYLFRHFRNDESLQQFADHHTVDELAKAVFDIASVKAENRAIKDIVLAYSCVVGLTFKNAREVHDALAGRDIASIVWANRIMNMWTPYPTVVETMELSSPLPSREPAHLSEPSKTSELNTVVGEVA